MSAVIAQFPANPRAVSASRRAVKLGVDERAKSSGATLEQRTRALSVALTALARGTSPAAALQLANAEMPRVARLSFRQPTGPGTAA